MQELIDEDKILYRKFLDGNKESFEKLIMKHKNNLIYFIFKYVKNKEIAEDIFQETAIYLMERKEVYDFKFSFKTFLYTIAKSKALNYLRDNKNHLSIQDSKESLVIEEKMIEDIIFSQELKVKLRNVLSKMKQEHQMVIYLTMIEELTYEETAKIMDKTISQIKNLVHRARTKLKRLLIEEKIVEIRGNKIIKLLTPFIILVLTAGIAYAGIKIYEGIKKKANLSPVTTQNLETNSAWVGTFQLAWNEFIEKRLNGNLVEFDDEATLNVVDELNKMEFTKDYLSEKDYYITVSEAKPSLKKEISKNIDKKFGIKNSQMLEQLDFSSGRNSYIIYAMLVKNFEFLEPFDRLQEMPFNDSERKIKYFGINGVTDEKTYNNLEVLFYDGYDKDLAVKIYTKEGEELILYRTDNLDKTFNELYKEIEQKSESFDEEKKFVDGDYLKIPYMEIDTIISYEELCGKTIKGTNGMYIEKALQNLKFSLNEKGGSLISEAAVQDATMGSSDRYFTFHKPFVIFMKEENKEKPYFALKIDNTDLLVEKELFFVDREVNQQMIDKLKEAANNTEFVRIFDRYNKEGAAEELFNDIFEELEENPREEIIPESLHTFYHACFAMPGNGMYEDELKILNEVYKEVDFRKLEEDLK